MTPLEDKLRAALRETAGEIPATCRRCDCGQGAVREKG